MTGKDVVKPTLFGADLMLVETVRILQLVDQLVCLLKHLLLKLVQLWRQRRVHTSTHWLPVYRFLHGWRVLLAHWLVGVWWIAWRWALGRVHSWRIVVRRVGSLVRVGVYGCRRIMACHATHATYWGRILLSDTPTIVASSMGVIRLTASLTSWTLPSFVVVTFTAHWRLLAKWTWIGLWNIGRRRRDQIDWWIGELGWRGAWLWYLLLDFLGS